MNTTENNKLIADFMGTELSDYGDEKNNYHTDWNWLMEVVENIESLGFEVLIGRISCQINPILERENPISSFVCGDISKKIEIVYSAIIQFIKWHNEQNKDLFSTPELLPKHIKAILGNYETDCLSYADCQKMLAEMESFSYTFEFGLDAVPFNLRKLPNHE